MKGYIYVGVKQGDGSKLVEFDWSLEVCPWPQHGKLNIWSVCGCHPCPYCRTAVPACEHPILSLQHLCHEIWKL